MLSEAHAGADAALCGDASGKGAAGPPARFGTGGRRRLDPHPDPGSALNALAAIASLKRRRGYADR